MDFLDDLRLEHQLIESVAGSLRAFAGCPSRDDADAGAFVRFFEVYAGAWHHGKEEDVLFAALTVNDALPSDHGPIAVLLNDHGRMAALLREMRASCRDDGSLDRPRFDEAAVLYVRMLLAHIDAENSVLFPECEDRLKRSAQFELDCRRMSPAEQEAATNGELLIARYQAVDDPELIRGEGCVSCPAYGDSCDGIEREWWNEWQWEELDDHVAAS